MLSWMFVATLLQQPRLDATISQSRAKEAYIQDLSRERTRFFKTAESDPNSGYFYGPEGTWHDIYFPIGKSSPMYFEAYVNGGKYEVIVCGTVVSVKAPSPYVVTCWRKTDKGARKDWQHWFIVKNNDPNNVVKVVNKKGKYWREALAFTTSKAPFVVNHFGIHGDTDIQRRCEFPNMEATENDQMPDPYPQNLTVPNGEVSLMRKLHLFPKPQK